MSLYYAFRDTRKNIQKQECIPVGCIPPAAVAVQGGVSTRHPPDQAPAEQIPPRADPPRPGIPQEQMPPGPGTPQEQAAPLLQGMLGYHLKCMLGYHTPREQNDKQV